MPILAQQPSVNCAGSGAVHLNEQSQHRFGESGGDVSQQDLWREFLSNIERALRQRYQRSEECKPERDLRPRLVLTDQERAVLEAYLRRNTPEGRGRSAPELVMDYNASLFPNGLSASRCSTIKADAWKKISAAVYYVAWLTPPGTFEDWRKICHVLDIVEGITLELVVSTPQRRRRLPDGNPIGPTAKFDYGKDLHGLAEGTIKCLRERAEQVNYMPQAWEILRRTAEGLPIEFEAVDTSSFKARQVQQDEDLARRLIEGRLADSNPPCPDDPYLYPPTRRTT